VCLLGNVLQGDDADRYPCVRCFRDALELARKLRANHRCKGTNLKILNQPSWSSALRWVAADLGSYVSRGWSKISTGRDERHAGLCMASLLSVVWAGQASLVYGLGCRNENTPGVPSRLSLCPKTDEPAHARGHGRMRRNPLRGPGDRDAGPGRLGKILEVRVTASHQSVGNFSSALLCVHVLSSCRCGKNLPNRFSRCQDPPLLPDCFDKSLQVSHHKRRHGGCAGRQIINDFPVEVYVTAQSDDLVKLL
jgi:hypothetical protein